MSNKVAFLTTIFPMEKEYLTDFFTSLQDQSYKSFDVIVVNDGYEDFENILKNYSSLNIVELKFSSTPSKNREHGINYAKKSGYDHLIFGDSDDYFSEDRIRVCMGLLNEYEIVVNDLSLFDKNGIYSEKYFSNRLDDKESVDINMIKDKNLFGLSNTAIRLDILDVVDFSDELIAVDWYFYTKLLLENKKAVFTNQALTFYRQYAENTIGMNGLTLDNLKKGINVKSLQYKLLSEQGWDFIKEFNEINDLKKIVFSEAELMSYLDHLKENKIDFPFWWEEIKLLRNNHEVN